MKAAIFRLVAVLWALASVTLPGGLAIAHAGDAAAVLAPLHGHVESETAEGCLPAHGADCALCSCHRWSARATGHGPLRAATTDRARPESRPRTPALPTVDPGGSFRPRDPPAA